MAIGFLREHFVKLVVSRNYDIREDDICYIVTVPAIWSDAAKQFMKEAATKVCQCLLHFARHDF